MRSPPRVVWLILFGALALRLVLFIGRGDYIAFDEGWYLLLARSLLEGNGYALSGLRHVALSPLFPIAAGAAHTVVGDIVWAGRLVAALASALLIVPCWFIFRRLAGQRTALLGVATVAVMPSLAPFVAPYWIGWDLWVGAEPLLHLSLYAGIALCVVSWPRLTPGYAIAAGACLGLAYLARPEAIIATGVLLSAVLGLALWRRNVRATLSTMVIVIAFAATAAPYWIYLHDALGRWTITGRDVPIASAPAHIASSSAGAGPRPVDDMLWGDDGEYARTLYALAPNGRHLADPYWGIQPQSAVSDALARTTPLVDAHDAGATSSAEPGRAVPASPGRIALYSRALGRIVPVYVWPFLFLGLLAVRRRASATELVAAAPVAATSFLVAAVVAVDPRTQLVVVPLAAYYIARGVRVAALLAQRSYLRQAGVRRSFARGVIAIVLLTVLAGTSARRLYMSVAVGSPHHLAGAENRRAAQALKGYVPADQPIMSWHPALALFADRDWRVLPQATLPEVLTYANAIGSQYILLSAYYPAPLPMDEVPGRYMFVNVTAAPQDTRTWQVRILGAPDPYLRVRMEPAEEQR
jgi:hypothetical protein